MARVTFPYESVPRLRVAFLGTSGHALRNYLPSLAYIPVDLVALWDPDSLRAEVFARQFGAASWYTDLDRMLRETAPDAVFICVEGYDATGPLSTELVARCFQAGCHVWCDKPVAAHAATARKLIRLRDGAGRIAAVGAKTMHNPAYARAREIVLDPAFGEATSFSIRYPLRVPRVPGSDLADREVRSCLNHVWHPVGAALLTMGPIADIDYRGARAGGGGVAIASFRSGAVGTFHFSAGQASTSPLERLEIVGEGSNVTVDNAAHLTWYRRTKAGEYGRAETYFTDTDGAPVTWQPELSLGQLYNNNNFMQGYALSLISFVEAVGLHRMPEQGTLEDASEILRVFELIIGWGDDAGSAAGAVAADREAIVRRGSL